MKYQVVMEFKYHLGEVYDSSVIAEFNSEERARQYVAICKALEEEGWIAYEVRTKERRTKNA